MTAAMTDATSATTNVERYLACMAAHDWDGLAATIADDGLMVMVTTWSSCS